MWKRFLFGRFKTGGIVPHTVHNSVALSVWTVAPQRLPEVRGVSRCSRQDHRRFNHGYKDSTSVTVASTKLCRKQMKKNKIDEVSIVVFSST
jgi:hypothetical protein